MKIYSLDPANYHDCTELEDSQYVLFSHNHSAGRTLEAFIFKKREMVSLNKMFEDFAGPNIDLSTEQNFHIVTLSSHTYKVSAVAKGQTIR